MRKTITLLATLAVMLFGSAATALANAHAPPENPPCDAGNAGEMNPNCDAEGNFTPGTRGQQNRDAPEEPVEEELDEGDAEVEVPEEIPDEEIPDEEAPDDDTPIEDDAPVDDTPVDDDTPIEDDAPADDAPVDDTPVDDTPVEDDAPEDVTDDDSGEADAAQALIADLLEVLVGFLQPSAA